MISQGSQGLTILGIPNFWELISKATETVRQKHANCLRQTRIAVGGFYWININIFFENYLGTNYI